jgi:hypothetical protein
MIGVTATPNVGRGDISSVDGWLTDSQAAMLADAATGCPLDGEIVEIGSFRGKSTIVLAMHAPEGAAVVAIDPHAGNDRGPQEIEGFEDEAAGDRAAFEKNLAAAGVRHRVRHVREFSDRAHGAVHGSIDVLYIDGAHRYRPARADIRDWGARVADGGEMLIHDSFSSVGVTLAIVRELVFGGRFRYLGRSRSLVRYRADLTDAGVSARVRNAARQIAQLPWFARNVALKVLLTLGVGKMLRRPGRTAPEWPY